MDLYYIFISEKLPPMLTGPHPHREDVKIPKGYHSQLAYDSLQEAIFEFEWYADRASQGVSTVRTTFLSRL